MLPYYGDNGRMTDDELLGSSDEDSGSPSSNLSDSEKLHAAFQNIRRCHEHLQVG